MAGLGTFATFLQLFAKQNRLFTTPRAPVHGQSCSRRGSSGDPPCNSATPDHTHGTMAAKPLYVGVEDFESRVGSLRRRVELSKIVRKNKSVKRHVQQMQMGLENDIVCASTLEASYEVEKRGFKHWLLGNLRPMRKAFFFILFQTELRWFEADVLTTGVIKFGKECGRLPLAAGRVELLDSCDAIEKKFRLSIQGRNLSWTLELQSCDCSNDGHESCLRKLRALTCKTSRVTAPGVPAPGADAPREQKESASNAIGSSRISTSSCAASSSCTPFEMSRRSTIELHKSISADL